jgi:hypothetical protein
VDSDLKSPMDFEMITCQIGSEISADDADEDEGFQCGTFAWCLRNWKSGWRILRVMHDRDDIAAIPIGTDGKWRVRRLRVIDEVPMSEWGEGPWSNPRRWKGISRIRSRMPSPCD